MKTRYLGNSGLKVSAVGLGCMGFSHAYGTATDRNDAIRGIRAAYEIGYTFFDTAECYTGENADGTESNNERLVGEALGSVRQDVVIATKFGVRITADGLDTDSRPETIRKSVDASLKRLGTDYIDLYYQHRIDANTEPETVASVMAELIRAGKIRTWGISEATEDYLRRAHAVCPVTAIQNRYSMMARHYEALFPVLEDLGVGFVAFSPMANGLLTGHYGGKEAFAASDYRSRMPQFSEEAAHQNLELLSLLNKIAGEKSAAPAQISLAWMISKKPYIIPIPGSRNVARMRENAGAAEVVLTSDEVALLDAALDRIPMSAVFGGMAIKRSDNK